MQSSEQWKPVPGSENRFAHCETVEQVLRSLLPIEPPEVWDALEADALARIRAVALAALRPFIAAEIRAWAVRNMTETDQSRTPVPAWQMLMRLDRDASAIAARITTTGEQHE